MMEDEIVITTDSNTKALSGKRKKPDSDRSDDTKDVLKDLFAQLKDRARQIRLHENDWRDDVYDEACESYNEFVRESLTKYPELATFTDPEDDEHSPLLYTVVTELEHDYCHPAIRQIIKKNPSALLWVMKSHGYDTMVDHMAIHNSHHLLLPWIAINYRRVLDRLNSAYGSPDFHLVQGFIKGTVPERVLREFLHACPRILFFQPHRSTVWKNTSLPLHEILSRSRQECSAPFFKWMVGVNFGPLGLVDSLSGSILRCAILALRSYRTKNMAEICRFIVENRPELAQDISIFDELRLESNGFFNSAEKDVILFLIVNHQKPFKLEVEIDEPSDIYELRDKLMMDLEMLLDERKHLEEHVSLLPKMTKTLIETTSCTHNTLHTGLSSVFRSWSELMMQHLERKLDGIPLAIDQVWTTYENQYNAEYFDPSAESSFTHRFGDGGADDW